MKPASSWHRCISASLTPIIVTLLVLVLFPETYVSGRETREPRAELGRFDHVRILAHDLTTARDIYCNNLGFAFAHAPYIYAEGSAHDVSYLPDDSYVELIGITDRTRLEQARPWIVQFLDRHQGAHSIGLRVASAQQISDRLKTRGIEAPIFKLTRSNPQDSPVLLVTPSMTHLPEGSIFFLQYPVADRNTDTKSAAARPANTVTRIRAVWIVVRDMAMAANDVERLGFRAGRSTRLATLNADIREFSADDGNIVLVHANGTGLAADFTAERAEGVLGITLEVADLKHALELIKRRTGQSLALYHGLYGSSFSVAAGAAAGVWIEMVGR